ncbi:MAG: hypothetical protein ABI409_16595 [Ramlibacter sp.]
MNKLSILILSGLFATGAFAQAASTAMPEAQKQGSEKAEAAAEATHNAKIHGTTGKAKQPEAQTAGSRKAQAAAERKHLAKSHTGKGKSTDELQAKDAKKL